MQVAEVSVGAVVVALALGERGVQRVVAAARRGAGEGGVHGAGAVEEEGFGRAGVAGGGQRVGQVLALQLVGGLLVELGGDQALLLGGDVSAKLGLGSNKFQLISATS